MITIQIRNGQGQIVGTINDFFALSVQDEVNKGGSLKLSIPATDWIRATPLQKGYRISVNYGINIKKNLMLFDGYLSDFVLKSQRVEIEAYNWLHYLQYRLIKTEKKYSSVAIKAIVAETFAQLNQDGQLPFVLGKNDSESLVSLEISAGTSFFDLLRQINEQKADCLFRIVQKQGVNFLEVGEGIGEVLQGVRECDTTDPGKTNIVNREWKDSMDEFRNAQGQLKNEEHIEQTGLLFERAEEENKNSLPKSLPLPAITISRDTDWWDFSVGDRKAIRLITGYERLSLSYTGLIQERKISIGAGGLKSEIKVSQEYREDVNVLDAIIKNLKKKKRSNGSSQAPTVDLSGYATSSAVAQALQSQNAKIETKASQSFVEGVALAVQTALNTANSKAPLQHTHNKNEVGLGAVDNTSDEDKPLSRATREALTLKSNLSDIVDDLNSEETNKPLSARQGKVLKNLIDNLNTLLVSDDADLDQLQEIVNYIKQNKTTLDQLGISNIAGLQNALNNKANKVHTHTKSQITDFPSSMPASDVYARAKAATKPIYNWNEIQLKPATFTPAPHHHYIEVNVTTAWNIKDKVGTTTQGHYIPKKGDRFLVNFVHGTVIARPTLNIDGSGAKAIRAGYYDVGTNMLNLNKTANSNIKVFLWYDGSHYQMFGAGHNSTYGEIPEAEIRDPSKTAGRTISGRRIAKIKQYFEQNVPTPTAPNHSVNKQYVDGLVNGINTTLQSLGQTQQRILTKAQWKALQQKDPNTIYFVKGVGVFVGGEKIIANDTPGFKMMH